MSAEEKTKKPKPLVSVITVTYNAGKQLAATLENVARQQFDDLEVIVVDGKSTDDTVSVIKRYAGVVTQWVSEPDGGIYDAMNKGVRMASGQWVIFMNAGDKFAADDVLRRVFQHDVDGAGVIYGDVVKDGKVKKATADYRLYHRMLFCHQSSLTRRTLLVDCPFDVSHRLSADLKFFITQYLRGTKFMYVGLPIADFDTSGVSNSHRSDGLRDNMRVIRETVRFPKNIPSLLRLTVPYVMCRLRGK